MQGQSVIGYEATHENVLQDASAVFGSLRYLLLATRNQACYR